MDKPDINDIKEAAKGLVAFCIRNNTSLEDIHAEQLPITDERMKQLMKECVNNVYFILLGIYGHNKAKKPEEMIEMLTIFSKDYAFNWDDPELPKWDYLGIKNNDN